MNSKTQPDWKQILKILIAVLTALAGALGVASCVA
ncbi:MAG: smalltalk protein [Bacteroidaceae bacterium]|nr:smalltalk protein [Bacteroidaceae bacterium]